MDLSDSIRLYLLEVPRLVWEAASMMAWALGPQLNIKSKDDRSGRKVPHNWGYTQGLGLWRASSIPALSNNRGFR
jgi:hypothetical protein